MRTPLRVQVPKGRVHAYTGYFIPVILLSTLGRLDPLVPHKKARPAWQKPLSAAHASAVIPLPELPKESRVNKKHGKSQRVLF